ncbi:MAG: copper-binding protein [Betaproteobacteria bacterium]|jgi:hypothetical protein|nr:copper-binding protein [Betaproteobacteria bacterium]
MRSIVVTIVLAVAVGVLPAANAQTAQGVVATGPGVAGVAKTVDITATITAIDAKTRAVTLKGPQGNEKTIVAGPEVKNFAKLKVGDQVTVQYLESLVLELKKGSDAVVGRTEKAGGARAPEGGAPGGVVGRQVKVVGEVTAVDAAAQTVTVRGPKQTVDMKIADPEQFKRVAVGDKIEATYTQAAAIDVKPVAAK